MEYNTFYFQNGAAWQLYIIYCLPFLLLDKMYSFVHCHYHQHHDITQLDKYHLSSNFSLYTYLQFHFMWKAVL